MINTLNKEIFHKPDEQNEFMIQSHFSIGPVSIESISIKSIELNLESSTNGS